VTEQQQDPTLPHRRCGLGPQRDEDTPGLRFGTRCDLEGPGHPESELQTTAVGADGEIAAVEIRRCGTRGGEEAVEFGQEQAVARIPDRNDMTAASTTNHDLGSQSISFTLAAASSKREQGEKDRPQGKHPTGSSSQAYLQSENAEPESAKAFFGLARAKPRKAKKA
jgi:hypothetical protein